MSWTDLLDKWIAPTGIMVLVGGIVWGIQLNVAVLNLTKDSAEQQQQLTEVTAMLSSIAKTQATSSYIMDRMEHDLEETKDQAEHHDREANNWKHRIIRLEEKLGIENMRNGMSK